MEQKYTAYKLEGDMLEVVIFDDPDTRDDWIGAGFTIPNELSITEFWYRGERSVTEKYKEPMNKTL